MFCMYVEERSGRMSITCLLCDIRVSLPSLVFDRVSAADTTPEGANLVVHSMTLVTSVMRHGSTRGYSTTPTLTPAS
jgi:hypothetical protein